MTTSEQSTSDVALMACPACGHRVSERAAACPRCGDPIRTVEPMAQAPSNGSRKGSSGNVVAAVVSFVLPGVGQLAQGRLLIGIGFALCAFVGWMIWLGWVFHLAAAIEAAVWNGAD